MFFFLSAITNIVTLLYIAGFFIFMHTLPIQAVLPEKPVDAIVVLTGRQGRIAEGLRLFEQGHARFLYISGVHPDVKKAELIKTSKLSPEKMSCCVIFDSIAQNTMQNAVQTSQWARSQDIQTMILVTDDLHLRRAMSLFQMTMPDRTIIPHPLVIAPLFSDGNWKSFDAWLGAVLEYSKFLFVKMMG